MSGQVQGLDGQPLADVRVEIYDQSPTAPTRPLLASTKTDNAGRYTVAVPLGRIWVTIPKQNIGGQDFWGYDNTPLEVRPNTTISGIDFRPARVSP